MLGFYNLSLQGTSHIANDTVCQDASNIVKLENGWVVSVIADGVGSAKHSEIGSSTAVKTVIDYISNLVIEEWDVEELRNILQNAYRLVLEKISEIAENEENNIRDYDTTLTTAIYNGSQIVYAHAGDGGIVVLSNSGEFSQLTEVQKGEEFNCVQPLRSEKSWVFGHSENDICALAMFTDGIYDIVCPWLLANESQKIYINYVRLFMDVNITNVSSEEDFEILKSNAERFLTSDFNSNITDDKTIAVVINTDITPQLQSEEYYAEPDWNALQEENNKKLYDMEQPIGEIL